mgnify:CR=1 FL=1|jgi:hypothetical protein
MVLIGAAAAAAGDDGPKPGCALLKACGLEAPGAGSSCTAEQSRPIGGVTYDAQRCVEPKELLANGVSPDAGVGPHLFAFLGGRYRVVYDITGEAPISEAKFDYLAEDLPLAAKLASRFSKTKYTMRYLDATGKRFHAGRGDKLIGDAELLFLDSTGKRRVYFGSGTSKFGPWRLRGSAYVDIRIRPGSKGPGGVAYDVRIRTAPVNAMVNAIMRLGLFKSHVIGQIEETMKDLVGAAGGLATQGVDAVLKDPAFSPEERLKIQALAALPD